MDADLREYLGLPTHSGLPNSGPPSSGLPNSGLPSTLGGEHLAAGAGASPAPVLLRNNLSIQPLRTGGGGGGGGGLAVTLPEPLRA